MKNLAEQKQPEISDEDQRQLETKLNEKLEQETDQLKKLGLLIIAIQALNKIKHKTSKDHKKTIDYAYKFFHIAGTYSQSKAIGNENFSQKLQALVTIVKTYENFMVDSIPSEVLKDIYQELDPKIQPKTTSSALMSSLKELQQKFPLLENAEFNISEMSKLFEVFRDNYLECLIKLNSQFSQFKKMYLTPEIIQMLVDLPSEFFGYAAYLKQHKYFFRNSESCKRNVELAKEYESLPKVPLEGLSKANTIALLNYRLGFWAIQIARQDIIDEINNLIQKVNSLVTNRSKELSKELQSSPAQITLSKEQNVFISYSYLEITIAISTTIKLLRDIAEQGAFEIFPSFIKNIIRTFEPILFSLYNMGMALEDWRALFVFNERVKELIELTKKYGKDVIPSDAKLQHTLARMEVGTNEAEKLCFILMDQLDKSVDEDRRELVKGSTKILEETSDQYKKLNLVYLIIKIIATIQERNDKDTGNFVKFSQLFSDNIADLYCNVELDVGDEEKIQKLLEKANFIDKLLKSFDLNKQIKEIVEKISKTLRNIILGLEIIILYKEAKTIVASLDKEVESDVKNLKNVIGKLIMIISSQLASLRDQSNPPHTKIIKKINAINAVVYKFCTANIQTLTEANQKRLEDLGAVLAEDKEETQKISLKFHATDTVAKSSRQLVNESLEEIVNQFEIKKDKANLNSIFEIFIDNFTKYINELREANKISPGLELVEELLTLSEGFFKYYPYIKGNLGFFKKYLDFLKYYPSIKENLDISKKSIELARSYELLTKDMFVSQIKAAKRILEYRLNFWFISIGGFELLRDNLHKLFPEFFPVPETTAPANALNSLLIDQLKKINVQTLQLTSGIPINLTEKQVEAYEDMYKELLAAVESLSKILKSSISVFKSQGIDEKFDPIEKTAVPLVVDFYYLMLQIEDWEKLIPLNKKFMEIYRLLPKESSLWKELQFSTMVEVLCNIQLGNLEEASDSFLKIMNTTPFNEIYLSNLEEFLAIFGKSFLADQQKIAKLSDLDFIVQQAKQKVGILDLVIDFYIKILRGYLNIDKNISDILYKKLLTIIEKINKDQMRKVNDAAAALYDVQITVLNDEPYLSNAMVQNNITESRNTDVIEKLVSVSLSQGKWQKIIAVSGIWYHFNQPVEEIEALEIFGQHYNLSTKTFIEQLAVVFKKETDDVVIVGSNLFFRPSNELVAKLLNKFFELRTALLNALQAKIPTKSESKVNFAPQARSREKNAPPIKSAKVKKKSSVKSGNIKPTVAPEKKNSTGKKPQETKKTSTYKTPENIQPNQAEVEYSLTHPQRVVKDKKKSVSAVTASSTTTILTALSSSGTTPDVRHQEQESTLLTKDEELSRPAQPEDSFLKLVTYFRQQLEADITNSMTAEGELDIKIHKYNLQIDIIQFILALNSYVHKQPQTEQYTSYQKNWKKIRQDLAHSNAELKSFQTIAKLITDKFPFIITELPSDLFLLNQGIDEIIFNEFFYDYSTPENCIKVIGEQFTLMKSIIKPFQALDDEAKIILWKFTTGTVIQELKIEEIVYYRERYNAMIGCIATLGEAYGRLLECCLDDKQEIIWTKLNNYLSTLDPQLTIKKFRHFLDQCKNKFRNPAYHDPNPTATKGLLFQPDDVVKTYQDSLKFQIKPLQPTTVETMAPQNLTKDEEEKTEELTKGEGKMEETTQLTK